MKSLMELMKERPVLLDGGMGSLILAKNPTLDDFGSAVLDGCPEILNITRPQWIKDIHEAYFRAGADAVETNTFGCNDLVLSEFGIAHRTVELNRIAAQNAREVAKSFKGPRYVIGSVGPGTKLLTLMHVDYESMFQSYKNQMLGLLEGGVDALLIETAQDLGQIKLAVRAARHAMREMKMQVPIWTQVTIETTGSMLVGTDIQAALASLEMLGIDVIGMNCATGPDEMRPHIAYLSENSPFPISCLPNAGLPQNVGGKTVYPLDASGFAEKVLQISKDFGLNVVGGCCGTTPEHIAALAPLVQNLNAPVRKGRYERSAASLYSSVPLDLEPKPLFIGERTNANGSKKFKDLLAANDYDGLTSIAKSQLKEGAHLLDVCVAYVSRNEVKDMEELLRRVVTQVNIPLVIDSTEVNVIEKALQTAPGKCVVNSINFEDGEKKARQILDLCKEYGASIIALTIDEAGMAKTVEKKLEITERLYNLVVGEYKMNPGDLIIDPLTFTLGSGDEEFRKSAIATLDAIREIKSRFKGVRTVLGLSNVSFGLNPYARQMLNSMMLYHAVKSGLDMAILNASKIVPVAKIPEDARKFCEDLIFDRRADGYDPLKSLLANYSDGTHKSADSQKAKRAEMSIEERLKYDIIDGEKQLIVEDALEGMKTYKPLDIINNILLEGMKVVGERFGSGEMQLPFVLESAEAMKTAVKTLEPFMEKKAGYSKGKIILATVKGDVHDIGKNLVEIILSNNGFDVVNLGIKQPIESVIEKYKEVGADAIGLSGLLVKSTVVMKDDLEVLKKQGYTIPVILGGAALTRKFVEEDCQNVYPGPVFYAEDAFEGLRLMEHTCKAAKEGKLDAAAIRSATRQLKNDGSDNETTSAEDNSIKVVRKGSTTVNLDPNGQSVWVRKNEKVPVAPFFGTRIVEEPLDAVFKYLDEFALIRSRWAFSQGSMPDEEFNEVLRNKAEPLLKYWREKVTAEHILIPRAVYGYFPAASEGNTLYVYHPDTPAGTPVSKREVIARFDFPRQTSGRLLCISDFYRHVSSGELDVLGVQVVTMGARASEVTAKLYAEQKFSEYFYLHGLSTELTEAYAEMIHARIRRELGVHQKDATNIRQLFSQGYQGSRYSFGYPACPDMEGNAPLLRLLEAERIGITLSETFQMVPEQSTSAIVSWHPQARYFST